MAGGRPSKEREAELEAMRPTVRRMAAEGSTVAEIAEHLGIDKNTIRGKRFKDDYYGETAELKLKLRRKQIEVALKGNVPMLQFLGKHILGQIDQQDAPAADKKLNEIDTKDLLELMKQSDGKVTQLKK